MSVVVRSMLVKLAVDSNVLNRGFQQAEQGTEKLKKKIHGIAPEIGMAERAIGSLGKSLLAMGASAAGFGAITAGLKSVIGTAADFDQKMSKVRALAGGTEGDFNRLREAAVKLGSATVFSASEAADGMAVLAAAGMSTNEVLSAMPALLAGAAAAGGDFNATANTLVGTLGGFGLAATDSAHVMDVLASAANDSRMNITDMGDVFKFTASSAAAYGVSLEEVAAAAVIMSNKGLEAGQTGRYLNQVFQQIAKPSDEAGAAMQRLGLDFFDVKGAFIGLAPLVDQLKLKLGGLTVEQRSNALATIFGTEASNAMLKLMQAGAPVLAQTAEGYHHVDGAVKKMAETMTQNLAGSIEQLKGALESLAIKIGSTTLSGLKGMTDATTDLINETGKLATEALPLLEKSLNQVAAAFGVNFTEKLRTAASVVRLMAASFMALNAAWTGDLGKAAEALLNAGTAGLDLGFGGNRASGGPISGPGTGTSDSILARVSSGEYIVNAASASKLGLPLLNRLNSYASGGGVGAVANMMPALRPVLTPDEQRLADLMQLISALMYVLQGVAAGSQKVTGAVREMVDKIPGREGADTFNAIKDIFGGMAEGIDSLVNAVAGTNPLNAPAVDPATAKLEADVKAMGADLAEMQWIANAVKSRQHTTEAEAAAMGLTGLEAPAAVTSNMGVDEVTNETVQMVYAMGTVAENLRILAQTFFVDEQAINNMIPAVRGAGEMLTKMNRQVLDLTEQMSNFGNLMSMVNMQQSNANLLHFMNTIATGTNITDDWAAQLQLSSQTNREEMNAATAINDIWARGQAVAAAEMAKMTGTVAQAGAAFSSVSANLQSYGFSGPISPATAAAIRGGTSPTAGNAPYNPYLSGNYSGTAGGVLSVQLDLDGKRLTDGISRHLNSDFRGAFTGRVRA